MAYRKKSARTRSYRLSLVRRKPSSAWHSASNSSSDKSRHRASSERSRSSPLEVITPVSLLTGVITSGGEERDRSLDALCRDLSLEELLAECQALDRFRRTSDNLYERVRALFFLYAIHRFHIPLRPAAQTPAPIPFAGYANLLKRRFEEAIDLFLAALAAGYKSLAFQTLADQVR